MTTYRTVVSDSLGHWGVTIVREQDDEQDQLVAVVVNGDQALAERICALLNASGEEWNRVIEYGEAQIRASLGVRDSCICPDPNCPVHHGRRARGPKPPPVGPGCVCDGSGRTCPRHGVVL
ncbi:MAG: hypothetical protein JWO11_4487 [Nocardioides sp.]|nr:hypothetical protein [Nocardioides sp.]